MTNTNLTICFDLDGTVVDTAADLIKALDYSLSSKSFEMSDPDQIRPIIGEGAKAMIKTALSSQSMQGDEPLIDELWHIMIAHYQENLAEHSRPFEGAVDLLENLKANKVKLAICTNKSLALTLPLLKTLQLMDLFDAITAGDSYDFKKPDPRHLWETIKESGGEQSNAIMVGDSATDINAAKNASIPVIGVEWGYSKIPINQLAPDITISHFKEFKDALKQLGHERVG